ncbi:MAG: nucleoside monophosphate kinase [Acidobacteriaceae bacterium]|nr:nucleoside monophosphate kinase [Acidobacteriaceae bacterium]
MYVHGTVVIFLGPPGSGKGTQAARLASTLGIPAISTGEILRRECRSGSELGTAVETVLESGHLVGDELMNQVVAHRLLEDDCHGGCILDGYPRTAAQARFLNEFLWRGAMPQPLIFDFRLPFREIVARLGHRRQCPKCGRIISLEPGKDGSGVFCERDGSLLIQRADDRPDVIRARMRLYEQNAKELTHYYRGQSYHRISAGRPPEAIADDLLRRLGPAQPKRRSTAVSGTTPQPAWHM